MGGLIALGYVLSEQPRPQPDLLVLSAPGLDDNLAGWKRPLAALLTNVVPKMQLANGVPAGSISRDPAVEAASAVDPLCSDKSTVRFGAEAFAEQDRVNAALAAMDSMPIPTYVFHGSDDPLVPVSASAVLEGKGNVTRQVHAGLRHECHHEPEHEDVLAEVVAWIRANRPFRLPPPAFPPTPPPTKPWGRCRLRRQPHIRLRGAPRALRVWCRPQTRGT